MLTVTIICIYTKADTIDTALFWFWFCFWFRFSLRCLFWLWCMCARAHAWCVRVCMFVCACLFICLLKDGVSEWVDENKILDLDNYAGHLRVAQSSEQLKEIK